MTLMTDIRTKMAMKGGKWNWKWQPDETNMMKTSGPMTNDEKLWKLLLKEMILTGQWTLKKYGSINQNGNDQLKKKLLIANYWPLLMVMTSA